MLPDVAQTIYILERRSQTGESELFHVKQLAVIGFGSELRAGLEERASSRLLHSNSNWESRGFHGAGRIQPTNRHRTDAGFT